jgi:hypothetical protein
MKVYLSSTLNDLGPERQAVKDALGSECIVVESYIADERSLRESCLADVAGCDLYIGIVGLRYGFIPPGETLSITHLEYEKARGTVPTWVFIKDAAAVVYSRTDAFTNEHSPDLIESFRKELSSGAQAASRVAVFRTPEDLKSHVLKAVLHLRERQGERSSSAWPQQVVESHSTAPPDSPSFVAKPTIRQIARIAVSYRRSDSKWTAQSIFDRLVAKYGKDSVFMDIDSIPFGIDFREHIDRVLRECHILIVLVGRKWVGRRRGRPSRINEENDLVRIEVETALQRRIPVIPVLIDGCQMPQPTDLPDTLRDFLFRNAAEIAAGRDFDQQIDRLIRSMDRLLGRS